MLEEMHEPQEMVTRPRNSASSVGMLLNLLQNWPSILPAQDCDFMFFTMARDLAQGLPNLNENFESSP